MLTRIETNLIFFRNDQTTSEDDILIQRHILTIVLHELRVKTGRYKCINICSMDTLTVQTLAVWGIYTNALNKIKQD